MKFLTTILSRVYQYTTAVIVVGSPLLFIPKTSFTGEATYHIIMMILVGVALLAYVINAILTRTWHTVSRLEFFAYFAFSISVGLSALFSKNPGIIFFGDGFNMFSGAALLALPAIMYLVRSLPEKLRHTLKIVMAVVLSVSAFIFVTALMIGGSLFGFAKSLFGGFSSSVSFASYLGIFTVGCFLYLVKGRIAKKWKFFVASSAMVLIALLVALASQDGIKPSFQGSLIVGKKVLVHNTIFGIGAGNFSRAWQLYRTPDVINSPYFGFDFSQGSSTVSTLFVTIGIVGLVSFILLILSSLLSTYTTFREKREGSEHTIVTVLLLTLAYLTVISFVVPLSYGMLVLWMCIGGLGVAKARLNEFHPSKKLAYLFVPVALLLIVNSVSTVVKAHAFSLFAQAQTSSDLAQAEKLVQEASRSYKYDGFYRTLVEYAITYNQKLVASVSQDQEQFKNEYLRKAKIAVDAGKEAVKVNPDNYQNYVTLGRAYELAVPFDKDGAFANAKKSYEEAAKLFPDNPYIYLMLARLETSAGTKEGVRQNLTEALRKKQNFADALYLMSQLEASENKIDEAITYAVQAIQSAPNDPAVYTQAGLLFYGKRDYVDAVLALKTALEKDPNNANIAYFLALSLRDGGRGDLAKPLADELLKRNPGNADLEKFMASLAPVSSTAQPVTTTDSTKKAPTKKK